MTLLSLPVLFAECDVIEEPPEVDLIAVIFANVVGFVMVPSWAIDPPTKLAVVHVKVSAGPFTVTLIDCVAVHVLVPLSKAET